MLASLRTKGHVVIRGALPAAAVASIGESALAYFAVLHAEFNAGGLPAQRAEQYGLRGASNSDRLIEGGVDILGLIEMMARSTIATLLREHFGDDAFVSLGDTKGRYYDPRSGLRNGLPFHQDSSVQPRNLITCWVPLMPCGRDAPGLEVVDQPFSETLPTMTSGDFPLPPGAVDHLPTVAPAFEPGDVLVFDHRTPHRSYIAPGMTAPRCSIEIRCMPGRLAQPSDQLVRL